MPNTTTSIVNIPLHDFNIKSNLAKNVTNLDFLILFFTFQFINLCDSFEEEETLPHFLNRKITKKLKNIAFSTFHLSMFD
jgi:hypothetical protein